MRFQKGAQVALTRRDPGLVVLAEGLVALAPADLVGDLAPEGVTGQRALIINALRGVALQRIPVVAGDDDPTPTLAF